MHHASFMSLRLPNQPIAEAREKRVLQFSVQVGRVKDLSVCYLDPVNRIHTSSAASVPDARTLHSKLG